MRVAGITRVMFAVSVLLAAGCSDGDSDESAPTAADLAYRPTIDARPAGWTGPTFELSHRYPTADPGDCRAANECPWLEVDVSTADTDWSSGGWKSYMEAILSHLKEGQDPNLNPGWKVDVGGGTRWFHVPWMAFDPSTGREFIHGLTNERTAHLNDLTDHGVGPLRGTSGAEPPGGLPGFETWAFGVYNRWGGYTLGQMWKGDGEPRVGEQGVPAGLPFREGTLVVKLLFTSATHLDASYLAGSPEWQANRHVLIEVGSDTPGQAATSTTPTTSPGGVTLQYDPILRAPQPVRLVQMDVAARDERAPTKWVYGTFGYNGTLPGADWWQRMSPLGAQWGSDPQRVPATTVSGDAQETSLAPINIYEHEGCATTTDPTPTERQKRLDGPVDNRVSSCIACHSAAYMGPVGKTWTPGQVPPIFFAALCDVSGGTSQADNARYFANYPFESTGRFTPYPGFPDAVSLDTSLQLQIAMQQYGCFETNGKACT